MYGSCVVKNDFQARAGSGLMTRIAPDDFHIHIHIHIHIHKPHPPLIQPTTPSAGISTAPS